LFAPPAAPSNLRVTKNAETAVMLSWTDNSTNEIGFKIYRSLDGSNFTQVLTTGAKVTSCTDSGLRADTKYFYSVRAYNSFGDSSPIPKIEVRTKRSGKK
jgi:hypothetical protein